MRLSTKADLRTDQATSIGVVLPPLLRQSLKTDRAIHADQIKMVALIIRTIKLEIVVIENPAALSNAASGDILAIIIVCNHRLKERIYEAQLLGRLSTL